MTERRTRSAVRKELETGQLGEKQLAGTNKRNDHLADRGNGSKRRKTKAELAVKTEDGLDGVKTEDGLDKVELPHNLGFVSKLQHGEHVKQEVAEIQKDTLNEKTRVNQKIGKTSNKKNGKTEISEKNGKAKKYGLTPGITPFPDYPRPTPAECEEVNRLLSTVHGEITPPATIPEPSLTVTGCGEVPSVLDALIRTLLSGATTSANSAMAFSGLVQKFGVLEDGIGKGSVNWEAVRQAPVQEVFEAIKSGGLADIKSKNLKAILDLVHQENQDRSRLEDAQPETKAYELACVEQHVLSLNHLYNPNIPTHQVMTELVKYPGIGPKTAACVLLFCLQRPCFAVDTHIFRLCKWLGWVPRKATEITAFSHLEVRVPDHLKYSLHQLLIRHGKSCPRCRAITGQGSAGWKDGCIIDHLVVRSKKK